MNVIGGVLGIIFGVLHAGPAITRVSASVAARGSHEPAAVPVWARLVWLALAVVASLGGVLLIVMGDFVSATVLAVGCVGLWLLAVANGYWIHGRPTISHHVVRGVVAAVLVGIAFLGASG